MKKCLISLVLFFLVGCATLSNDSSDEKLLSNKEGDASANDGPLNIPGYEPPKDIAEAIIRGDSALLQANLQKALFEYTQGLAILESEENAKQAKPEEKAKLYAKLGELNYSMNNLDAALYATNSSLKFNDKSIRAHELAGILFLKKRAYSMAEFHFLESIHLDRERIKKESMTNKPDKRSPFHSYTGLGLMSDLHKKFDESDSYFQYAIDIMPRAPQAYTNFGYSYYLRGNYPQAHKYFQKALSFDSGYVQAWRNLGMLYVIEGHEIEALKAFMTIEKDYEAYNDVGYVYQMLGKHVRARYFFNEAIDAAPHYFVPAYANLKNSEAGKNIQP